MGRHQQGAFRQRLDLNDLKAEASARGLLRELVELHVGPLGLNHRDQSGGFELRRDESSWRDYRSGRGGSVFDFIASFELGLECPDGHWRQVLARTAELLGRDGAYTEADRARFGSIEARRKADAEKKDKAKRAADREAIRLFVERGQPVAGTPAGEYLQARGISPEIDTRVAVYLPANAFDARPLRKRYEAAEAKVPAYLDHPSLCLWATTEGGLRSGWQRIVLRRDKPVALVDRRGKKAKLSGGRLRGQYGRLNAGRGAGPVIVAEGPETALSIAQATAYETLVSFGGFGQLTPEILPRGRMFILARDADEPGTPADVAVRACAERLRSAGIDARIAETTTPDKPGWDFNDALIRDGAEAVRGIFQSVILSQAKSEPKPFPANQGRPSQLSAKPSQSGYPEPKPAKADLEALALAGAKKHRDAVRTWFDKAIAHVADGLVEVEAPRELQTGAQGCGKSKAALEGIAKAVRAGRVAAMYLPSHAKCEEVRTDLEGLGVGAFVMRGRGVVHDGASMCVVPDAAARAAAGGANVLESLCKGCPFRDECRYLAQGIEAEKRVEGGGIILAPHAYLTARWPADVKPDLAIVDEKPGDALTGKTITLTASELGRALSPRAQSPGGIADALAGLVKEIRPLAVAAMRALRESPGAEIEDMKTQTPAWNADNARAARKALADFLDRQIGEGIKQAVCEHAFSEEAPDRLAARIDAVIARAIPNKVREHLALMDALILELDTDHPGFSAIWLDKRQGKDEAGAPVSEAAIAVRLVQPSRVAETTPMLALDGTGDPDLWRAMFGEMNHNHIPVPRQAEVTQVIDKSFSNASIIGTKYKPKLVPEAEKTRQDLGAISERNPGAFWASTKKVRDVLEPHLAAAGAVGHFGALRGLNAAEKCETSIVVGRELPPMWAIEAEARAIAARLGRPFASLRQEDGSWPSWPRRAELIDMRDGSTVATEIEFHPDPTAHMVLTQKREAELAQAIDRVRPIFNRRRIILLSPVAVPGLTVDKITAWKDMHRGGSKLERALREKVLLGGRNENVRCFPWVWANLDAIKRDAEMKQAMQAVQAVFAGGKTLLEIYMGFAPPKDYHVLVEYRLPSQGGRGGARKPHRAIVFTSVEEARSTLEAVTGPVAHFEIIGASEPRKAPENQFEQVEILPNEPPVALQVAHRADEPAQSEAVPLRKGGGSGPPEKQQSRTEHQRGHVAGVGRIRSTDGHSHMESARYAAR